MALLSIIISNESLLKLTSFLFWGWTYIWCTQKLSGHTPEWYSRAVTLLHGAVATYVGFMQCGVTDITKYRLTLQVTPSQRSLMLWSWGYFAFDLWWCIIYWPNNYIILCHHMCALIAVNLYLSKDYTGCTFACTLALMEVTNPLLQIRWFLREYGCDKSILYYVVEVTYLILFITLRAFLCTYLIYKILHSDNFDLDEKMVSLSLYAVSQVLVYEIVGYVTYKYSRNIEDFKGFANEVAAILNETI